MERFLAPILTYSIPLCDILLLCSRHMPAKGAMGRAVGIATDMGGVRGSWRAANHEPQRKLVLVWMVRSLEASRSTFAAQPY